MRPDILPAAAVAMLLIGAAACTRADSRSADAARGTGTGTSTAKTRPAASASPSPLTAPSRTAWPEPACPLVHRTQHAAIVDYADFIQWDDRSYIRSSRRVTAERAPARYVGTVNCEITELQSGPHVVLGRIRNGNAAGLPVGTRLYAPRDRPRCVLTARTNEGWAYWLAHGCHPTTR